MDTKPCALPEQAKFPLGIVLFSKTKREHCDRHSYGINAISPKVDVIAMSSVFECQFEWER